MARPFLPSPAEDLDGLVEAQLHDQPEQRDARGDGGALPCDELAQHLACVGARQAWHRAHKRRERHLVTPLRRAVRERLHLEVHVVRPADGEHERVDLARLHLVGEERRAVGRELREALVDALVVIPVRQHLEAVRRRAALALLRRGARLVAREGGEQLARARVPLHELEARQRAEDVRPRGGEQPARHEQPLRLGVKRPRGRRQQHQPRGERVLVRLPVVELEPVDRRAGEALLGRERGGRRERAEERVQLLLPRQPQVQREGIAEEEQRRGVAPAAQLEGAAVAQRARRAARGGGALEVLVEQRGEELRRAHRAASRRARGVVDALPCQQARAPLPPAIEAQEGGLRDRVPPPVARRERARVVLPLGLAAVPRLVGAGGAFEQVPRERCRHAVVLTSGGGWVVRHLDAAWRHHA
mmetsp:Transcript_12872/g.32105  ORF Transcript_12872/g.32105 Transcript_12872/m.32105 type:complete len:416 (-) Transcript_12872:886-2133(-)